KGKRFELRLGKIEASVARQRPLRPMMITTPQAEARVLGTTFTLRVATNATRLEVTKGKVLFTRTSDRAHVQVLAGSYAVAATNYELLAQPLTGSILREYWTNLPGELDITFLTSHPDFPDRPSDREHLSKFEAPSHWGTNYGARICGYLHPPKKGKYTFWIATGDAASFSLSPDDNPKNKRGIAFSIASSPHAWTEHEGQQSASITLVAGSPAGNTISK
ncbi:MAG: FecR domain-containing protein, partial [Verrucomicrobiota bacterium]